MVSAQIAGTIKLVMKHPNGGEHLVKAAPIKFFSYSGSSNGTTATIPTYLNFLPIDSAIGKPGDMLIVRFVPGASATLDISDAYWYLPLLVNGNQTAIGNPDNASGQGNDNFVKDYLIGDVALVAGTELNLAVFRAKEGVVWQVGGDKVDMSVEDNA